MQFKRAGLSLAVALATAAMVGGSPLLSRALAHGDHTRGNPSFSAGEPGDPAKPFRVIEIDMIDGPGKMAFSLDRIEIKKDEQIKFVLKNVGAVEHEFLVDSIVNVANHRLEMQKTPDKHHHHHEDNGIHLKPGASGEMLWRFSRKGIFEFACLISGHYETGMKGIIVVK